MQWRAFEDYLGQSPMKADGTLLSTDDRARVANAYTIYALLTRDILRRHGFKRSASTPALQNWICELVKQDVAENATQLANALVGFRHIIGLPTDASRRTKKAILIAYGAKLDHPAFKYILPLLYLGGNDARTLCDINCLLQYCCRLTLKNVNTIELEEKEKYLQLEMEMKEWQYDSEYVEDIRRVIRWMLADFVPDFETYLPHHSSGATAEVKRNAGIAVKYKTMSKQISKFDLASIPDGYRWSTGLRSSLISDGLACRVILVPKGINKKRAISMLPTSHVFVQNALYKQLYRYCRDTPRVNVHLEDQTINQKMCKRRGVATIDLSSASDRVTWQLCQLVLPKELLELIDIMRTKTATLSLGESTVTVELEKAFPMGSPLCFVIMSIILSAACVVSQERTGIYGDYAVYGDDIIVDQRVAPEMLRILDSLHMKVNTEKSYISGEFVESCGIEVAHGHVITPTRIPRRYDVVGLRGANGIRKYQCAESLQVMIEESWLYSFNSVHSYLSKDLPERFIGCRYNKDLQRSEYCVRTFCARETRGPDNFRYMELLRRYASTNRRSLLQPEDLIDTRVGPVRMSVKQLWLAADQI